MSHASCELSLSYLADLCSSLLSPAMLVDILSEFEATAQIDTSSMDPSTVELLSTYYSVYMLSLLLDQDLNEARFLLQRIHANLLAEPQFANTAALLRALYTRNYPSVYSTLSNPVWSATAAPLRDRFQDDFRKRTFLLLSRAYNSISKASVALYLGIDATSESTVKGLIAEGWGYDSTSGLLKPAVKYGGEVLRSTHKDERIGRLTALVTHLMDV